MVTIPAILQKIINTLPPDFLVGERQWCVEGLGSRPVTGRLVNIYWTLFGKLLPYDWPQFRQSDVQAEIAPCLFVRHWFCAHETPTDLLCALSNAWSEQKTYNPSVFATMLGYDLWTDSLFFFTALNNQAQLDSAAQTALQVQEALQQGNWQLAFDSLDPLVSQLRALPEEHQQISLVPLLFLQILLGLKLGLSTEKLNVIRLLPNGKDAFARFSLKPLREYLPLQPPATPGQDIILTQAKFAWCEYLLLAMRHPLACPCPPPPTFDERCVDVTETLWQNENMLGMVWLVNSLPPCDSEKYNGLLTISKNFFFYNPWSREVSASSLPNFFQQCQTLFPAPDAANSTEKQSDGTGRFLLLLQAAEEPLLPDQAYTLQSVEPVLLLPDKNGKQQKLQRLKPNQLLDTSLAACFPEDTRPLLPFLSSASTTVILPEEHWHRLCQLASVLVLRENETFPNPATLIAGRAPLLCNFAEQGKLLLQLPFHDFSSRHILVQRDSDSLLLYVLDDKFDKARQLFQRFGDGCQLLLPASAEAQLRALLPSLGNGFQLRGTALQDGLDGMDTADGTVALHFLIHKRSDEYSFKLRNAPLPDNPLLQFPGHGEALAVVSSGMANCLLRRDMSAETKAVDILLTQCPTLKSLQSETSPCQWLLTELDDVLQILAELHDASPAPVLEWRETKPVTIRRTQGQMNLSSRQTTGGWFLDGDLPLDDERSAALAQLLRSLPERQGDFVPLGDDEFLQLTDDLKAQLQSLRNATNDQQGQILLPTAALPSLENSLTDQSAEQLPEEIRRRLQEQSAIFASEPAVPTGLQCTLRDYQLTGFRWLSRLADCGIGGCLADDMGLGKTMQTLTLLLARADQGPSLVLAPASVCANWQREILRFAPSLQPLLLSAGERKTAVAQAVPRQILIGSYGLLRSLEEELAEKEWNCLILDEAQAIKNQSTKTSQAVKRLRAQARFALTGTPVENHLQEFWSIFDFLNPGLLGTAQDFQQRYSRQSSGELRRLLNPLLLRRLKTEVLAELPPKTETVREITMDDDERLLYDQLRRQAREDLDSQGGKQMQILAALTRLRRFCCHPSLVNPQLTLPGSKLQAALELAADLKASGHPALIFSQYTDFLQLVRDRLQQQGYSLCYLDGSLTPTARQQAIDKFQQGSTDFFLISLKAGGTGLTLTAASFVILLDPWWNPAVESQASDRVYRIGQKNPVTVYRLILSGTVEEKIRALQDSKRQLADNILENAGDGSLTREMLLQMFEP